MHSVVGRLAGRTESIHLRSFVMALSPLAAPDVQLRDVVIRNLAWDPQVNAGALGVSAKDGVVILSGYIDTYAGKLAAERAAKRVRGVRAVANELVVRLREARPDDELAHDVVESLKNPPGLLDIQAVVHHGHITLTGKVEWLFQRDLAERLVHHIRGVVGINNHITVTPRTNMLDAKRRIRRALHQLADVDARRIEVAVADHTVTLSGTAASWAEREAAELVTAQAPGVTQVNNYIAVRSEPLPEPVDEIC
jgi:osmotically-inducible protein OsmY